MPKTKKPTEPKKEADWKCSEIPLTEERIAHYIKEFKPKKLEEKTTWETSEAPLREPTPEEAKAIEEFIKNPELLTPEETSEFLADLRRGCFK